MMMCSRCKKRPAVVFITSLQGAEKKNEGLCLVCAKELNIPQVDEYMKQMGITEEELEQISNQMMDLMDGENFEMGGSGVLPQFFQSMQNMFKNPDASEEPDAASAEVAEVPDGEEPPAPASTDGRSESPRRERRSKRKKELKFLGNYCTNLSQRAADGELDAIIGRDREI